MGIAVHTGVGYGAIRPSGRSVQQNGLGDYAFVHPGQFGVVENLENLFGDFATVNQLPNQGIDQLILSDVIDGSLTPGQTTDGTTEEVFGTVRIDENKDVLTLTDSGVID